MELCLDWKGRLSSYETREHCCWSMYFEFALTLCKRALVYQFSRSKSWNAFWFDNQHFQTICTVWAELLEVARNVIQ